MDQFDDFFDEPLSLLEKWWFTWLAFLAGVLVGVCLVMWITGVPAPW